jgi:hypothetical protein
MAAKISHILVLGFCDSPPRESIPVAQHCLPRPQKMLKSSSVYLFPNINNTNATALEITPQARTKCGDAIP